MARMNSAGSVLRFEVLVVALLLGCNAAPPPGGGGPHFVVADVIVSVSNQSSRELQIYVGSGSQERELGPVPGRSSRSFSLPSGLGDSTEPLHFEARARRSTTGIRSDTFSVSPGEQVLWAVREQGSRAVIKR